MKVFCIDGYTTPAFVQWEDGGTESEVFKRIQQFCDTDMAKPCHAIQHDSTNPSQIWVINFWCDEDATLKPHEVTFKYLHPKGIQRFFNKIVAVCQDVNGDFMSITIGGVIEIQKRIEKRTYQFPLTVVNSV